MATRVTDGARRERLPPSFQRLASSPLPRSCIALTKSEEKERLVAVYTSPRDQWGALIYYYAKNDVNTLKKKKKKKQKMPVGKRDIITFYFFQKKTWIEENADWICSAIKLF